MANEKRRTAAVVWDPAVLPPPVRVGRGRRAVELEVRAVGRDLLVTITGGQGHAGAVAVAASAAGPAPEAQVVVLPPHKEGPLAEACALRVAAAAECACVVVAGIHQDRATRAEIEAIVANARVGVRKLAAFLERIPKAHRYCSDRLPKPSNP